jgi:hypothetical protein
MWYPNAKAHLPAATDMNHLFKHMKMGRILSHMNPSQALTRLYTGQGSLLTLQMEHFPKHFPRDTWVADAALEIFRREDPDLAYILLAQCDDGGHCIGKAHDRCSDSQSGRENRDRRTIRQDNGHRGHGPCTFRTEDAKYGDGQGPERGRRLMLLGDDDNAPVLIVFPV